MREGRSMSGARAPLGQCSLCSSMPRDSSTVAEKNRRFLLSRIFNNNYDDRDTT